MEGVHQPSPRAVKDDEMASAGEGYSKVVSLTRALERGGRFCPPLMFFANIFQSICSIAVIFSIPAQK